MLDAINILSYSLFGVMLLIIFVSAMVTYNLILSERAKDIGTMRALGFNEVDVRGILYVEVLGAALFALLAGFCISLLGSSLVSQIHISGLSDIDAFLKNGVLTAYFKPSTLGINILAVFCALFLAIIPPTIRTSRSGIPDLITGGVKE
jgi:putative ABC transport system permease protein